MVVETEVHEICACDCSWTRKEYFPRRELDDAMSSASNYLNILYKRKYSCPTGLAGNIFQASLYKERSM